MHAATLPEYRDRFWSKVDTSGDGCWEWQAGTGHWGYGSFRARGLEEPWGYREQLAHRWSWFFTYGELPRKQPILHSCDNPPCVRPSHLRLGTHADNAADRRGRGRNGNRQGERNGATKLTAADVTAIRARWVPNDRQNSTAAIARDFGVAQSNVVWIVTGKTWRHLL